MGRLNLMRLPGRLGASAAFQPQTFLRGTQDTSEPPAQLLRAATRDLSLCPRRHWGLLKKGRAGAATALEQEVKTRGVAPGCALGLRERLQGKINAFIRPTASLRRGRHPHTHTELPQGPVHPGFNPKISRNVLGSDQVCARGESPCL